MNVLSKMLGGLALLEHAVAEVEVEEVAQRMAAEPELQAQGLAGLDMLLRSLAEPVAFVRGRPEHVLVKIPHSFSPVLGVRARSRQ